MRKLTIRTVVKAATVEKAEDGVHDWFRKTFIQY